MPDYNQNIKEYYSEWWENPKDIRNLVFDSLNNYIQARIPSGNGKRALDLGSGKGRIISYLLDKGYEVTSVEFNEEFASELKRNFPEINVICDDVRNVEFNEEYDIVTCIELAQNLKKDDLIRLLETLSKITKLLLINISNKNSFHSFYINLRGWRANFVFLYTPDELEDYLEKTNFKVVHRKGIGLLTPVSLFKNFRGNLIPLKIAKLVNKLDDYATNSCHLYYVEAIRK